MIEVVVKRAVALKPDSWALEKTSKDLFRREQVWIGILSLILMTLWLFLEAHQGVLETRKENESIKQTLREKLVTYKLTGIKIFSEDQKLQMQVTPHKFFSR